MLAIGYYDHPNRLGVPGEDLPHVSHYYQEAHSSYRKRVVIVGGKNSAAEAALELFRGGAHVTMVHRRATLGASIKYWVKPDIENRIAEGSIAARFEAKVVEITPESVVIEHSGSREALPADQVLLLTGYHADFDLLRACGIEIDEASGVPLHDPSTLESTSVPGRVLRWRGPGRQGHRTHLHRERPVSWRADRQSPLRTTQVTPLVAESPVAMPPATSADRGSKPDLSSAQSSD